MEILFKNQDSKINVAEVVVDVAIVIVIIIIIAMVAADVSAVVALTVALFKNRVTFSLEYLITIECFKKSDFVLVSTLSLPIFHNRRQSYKRNSVYKTLNILQSLDGTLFQLTLINNNDLN